MTPLFYITNQDLRIVQTSFFQCSVIVLVGLMHVNKYLGFFLIYCAFQSLFVKQGDTSTGTNIVFGLVAYQFIVKCSNVSEFKKYFYALIAVLILNCFWCLRQYYNLDPIFSMVDQNHQKIITEPAGFFSLPAFFGNYAAVLAPISMVTWYWPIVFVVAGLFLSKSSFSVIAGTSGVLFFLWFRKRIYFWVVLLVLGLASGFYIIKYDLPGGQFNRRLNIWKLVEREAFTKQFFGHGIGSYKNSFFVEVTPSHETYRAADQEWIKK